MPKFSPQAVALTCLIVTAGLQSLSSSSSDRQTVPEGYTLGWKIGGSNLPGKGKPEEFVAKHQTASYLTRVSYTSRLLHFGGEVG